MPFDRRNFGVCTECGWAGTHRASCPSSPEMNRPQLDTFAVQPLFNETPEHRFNAFEPGDKLVASRHPRSFRGEVPEDVLGEAYDFYNRDDRPNGRTERSVSAGDILRVMLEGRLVGHWSVERPAGFRWVEEADVLRNLDWNHPSGIERDMERLAREDRGLARGSKIYINGEICDAETGEPC